MRERLRSFDSKITFFAFADIITAVSGMLIFITLLLATDLGRPTDTGSQAPNAELERQLHDTLVKQAEVDAQTRGLQRLLTAANTAPPPDKLESDISRLRSELAAEKGKHSGLAAELAASQSSLADRDRLLGITAVKEQIQESAEFLQAMARTNANIREQTAALEKQIAAVRTKIQKLQAREGQIWLIPERRTKSLEPILAVVSSKGVKIERFDRPDLTKEFDADGAHLGFDFYLRNCNPARQYVVFLIRPSGITMFKDLLEIARASGFEVGFDALEEDREIHFTNPPPLDDLTVPAGSGQGTAANNTPMPGSGSTGAPGSGGTYNPGGTPGGTEYRPGGTSAPEGPPGGVAGGTGTNAAGSTNGTASGTNTVGNGTNSIGGTNSVGGSGTNTVGTTNISTGTNASSNAKTNAGSPAGAPPPPKPKSWWQRLLEWLGIG